MRRSSCGVPENFSTALVPDDFKRLRFTRNMEGQKRDRAVFCLAAGALSVAKFNSLEYIQEP